MHMGDVVALHRLHKALSHAVVLRATRRCGQRHQTYLTCLFSGVRRAVIAQPLDRNGTPRLSKTFLDGFEPDVADVVTAVATSGWLPN